MKMSSRTAVLVASVLGVGLASWGVCTAVHTVSAKAQATQDLLTAVRDGGVTRTAIRNKWKIDWAARQALVADALRRGADPNAHYGTDPAPLAAGFRYVARHVAGYKEWDTTLEAHDRLSVLLTAAEAGDAGVMRLLLAAGANPGERAEGGETLLYLATSSPACVQIALDLGADPNERGEICATRDLVAENGSLPLEEAFGVPSVTRLLLAHGADPTRTTHGEPLIAYLQKMDHELSRDHLGPRWREADAARQQSLALLKAAAASHPSI